jgi:hypothetical protein
MGISTQSSHILTVPFITALEQLREVRGFKHQGRKDIEWKAASAGVNSAFQAAQTNEQFGVELVGVNYSHLESS